MNQVTPFKPIAIFKPLEWQLAALRDKSEVLLLTGSAGGGKSLCAGEKVHAYLKKYPNTMGLMLRKQRNSMTNSTVLFMERTVMGKDPGVDHYPSKNRFEYDNGSILAYGGMDGEEQKEQIRSIGQAGSLHIAWMEEANRFSEEDFNELQARMRGAGVDWLQIILTTNPDSPMHWIYKRLILGGEASVHYSKAADNTFNPTTYVHTLNRLTGVTKQRLAEGKWVQAEGVIYEEFEVDHHYIAPFPIPKDWIRLIGIDFGYTNPFVALFAAVDPDGIVYIYKEWYMSHRTVKAHGERILQELEKEGIEVDVIICDHDAGDRMTLEELGLSNIPATKDIERGLGVVKERLKIDPINGKARVYFFRNMLLEVDPEMERQKKPISTIEEFSAYVWSTPTNPRQNSNDREVPLKLSDHGCFVAGTRIMTDQGGVQIENILAGMNVLTRNGYCKVHASSMTNAAAKTFTVKFSNGEQLRGTGDHPIFVNDQQVRLDTIRYGDIINTLTDNPYFQQEYLCHNEKSSQLTRSNTRGSSFADTLSQRIGLRRVTTHLTERSDHKGWVATIKSFGKTILEKFQMVITSTIKTEIQPTMRSVTWSWLRWKNTEEKQVNCTPPNDLKKCESIYKTSTRWQKNGTGLPKEKNGINNTVEMFGMPYPFAMKSVSVVGKSLQREIFANTTVFVPTIANLNPDGAAVSITKPVLVSNVEHNLRRISTPKFNVVPVYVRSVTEDEQRVPVYNLTVQGTPEYYANGVLCHNCDTLRYILMYIDTYENQGMAHWIPT